MQNDILSTILTRNRTNRFGISTAAFYLNGVNSKDVGRDDSEWQNDMLDARRKLTYCSPEMRIESITKGVAGSLPDAAIAEFTGVITSTSKDRDGDILESAGATVDENLPLLWQHIPASPIGKLVSHAVEKTFIMGHFLLADTELGRDAAKLISLNALRISHGFNATNAEPIKDEGFHIKEFEIIEVSLVSVPANTDAVITAFGRGKFASPLIKSWAQRMYDDRPAQGRGFDTDAIVQGVVGELSPELKKLGDVFSTALPNTDDDDDDDYSAIIDENLVQRMVTNAMNKHFSKGDTMTSKAPDAFSILNMGAKAAEAKDNESNIRVKGTGERYNTKRYSTNHKTTGVPIQLRGVDVETTSQLQHAYNGAFFKNLAVKSGMYPDLVMKEHEKALLREQVETQTWINSTENEAKFLSGDHLKALIDDSSSGGESLVPDFVDTNIVELILLGGELMPFVDLVELPRGSTVSIATIGNVTLQKNTAEATAMTLFSTTGLITNTTAPVFAYAVPVEVGRDFESDSVVDIGIRVTSRIANKFAEILDEDIAIGDGTGEIEGIVVASGTADITAGNPTTGDLLLTDKINLALTVGKQYLDRGNTRFVMTQTSYKRFQSIATGVTGDTRTIFTHNAANWQLDDDPVSIVNSGLGNNEIIYGGMKSYRLWRRQGLQIEMVRGGQTLALRNTSLIIGRGRFAGKVIDPNAFAIMDSAPA